MDTLCNVVGSTQTIAPARSRSLAIGNKPILLEEGKMQSQVSREMGEISARVECRHDLTTPPGIKRAAEMLQNSKVRTKGGLWRIMKRLGSVFAPVPWLLF